MVILCRHKIWANMFTPHRCGKPAKFYYDGLHGPVSLCGIHVKRVIRRGIKTKPIGELGNG